MVNFKRVFDTSEYIKSGDYTPDNETAAIVRRLYAPIDNMFPIFSISIYQTDDEDGISIRISQSIKLASKGWWDSEIDIPLSLISELQEMIKEAKRRYLFVIENG